MKIAFINPFAHPDVLLNTHYHLLLAQYILNNTQYYTRWMPENRPPEDFIILDNGAAEGVYPSSEELVYVCRLIKPDVLILPDVLGDAEGTCFRTEHFLESDAWRFELDTRPKLMFVPQGKHFWAWSWCLRRAIGDYIGLAKRYSTGDFPPSACIRGRLELAAAAANLYPNKKQHLLGLTYPQELLAFRSNQREARNVVGVDTAMPWVLAQHNIFLPEYGLLYRPENWHSDEGSTYNTGQIVKARHNAQVLTQWAGN